MVTQYVVLHNIIVYNIHIIWFSSSSYIICYKYVVKYENFLNWKIICTRVTRDVGKLLVTKHNLILVDTAIIVYKYPSVKSIKLHAHAHRDKEKTESNTPAAYHRSVVVGI